MKDDQQDKATEIHNKKTIARTIILEKNKKQEVQQKLEVQREAIKQASRKVAESFMKLSDCEKCDDPSRYYAEIHRQSHALMSQLSDNEKAKIESTVVASAAEQETETLLLARAVLKKNGMSDAQISDQLKKELESQSSVEPRKVYTDYVRNSAS